MRIGFTLIALMFILIAPYWIYLPFILVGIIVLPFYAEAVPLSLLADVLYGGAGHGALFLGLPFAILSAILVLFAMPLRQHLRFQA